MTSDLNPDRILLVGDVHGEIRQLARALDYAAANDISVVVQLGDFGIWPGPNGARFIQQTNDLLEELDLTLLFVPGNHEDYDQIAQTPVDPETNLQAFGPQLFAMPRGYRTQWQGLNVAALGGAHSVDRQWRLQNAPGTHWEAEHVTEEEATAFAAAGPVDLLFMHDSPAGAPNAVVDDPHNQGAIFFPQEELYLAALHRNVLARAVNPTNPGFIAHGHYHRYMGGTYRPTGATRDCFVLGLSEGGEGRLQAYTQILDLQALKEDLANN